MSYMPHDMNGTELGKSLDTLGLTQADLAARLGVTARSVRRWQANKQPIPLWVREIISVWQQLHSRQLPWGADLASIWYGDIDQITRHMEHDTALAALLKRVEARGGPAAPWRINLTDYSATLGKITIYFYRLASGGFSLASYRRGDIPPDSRRDQSLIEDAVAVFSAELRAVYLLNPVRGRPVRVGY